MFEEGRGHRWILRTGWNVGAVHSRELTSARILPLGASIPKATVLRYGGYVMILCELTSSSYFPEGTSFPQGVQVPLHARMVNILPEETKDPPKVIPEGMCLIQ
jgi:hypothetical protein